MIKSLSQSANYLRSKVSPLHSSLILIWLMIQSAMVSAQESNGSTPSDNTNEIVLAVFVLTVLMVVLIVFVVADRLLKISAEKARMKEDDEEVSLMPSFSDIFPPADQYPYVAKDEKVTPINKGFDIRVRGRAKKEVAVDFTSSTFALRPKDFVGMSPIPKLMVEEGAEVKAGDQLFYDKKRPDIFYTAPVSGQLIEVRRGEKRSIDEFVILADKEVKFKEFKKADPAGMSREDVVAQMVESGAWTSLRQRPYNIVPEITEEPRDIFISAFDSSPLAANYGFTLNGLEKEFQAGIDALSKLTSGKVHLNLNAEREPAGVFKNAKGVQKNWFKGPHPAGNVGVQIHHISPIKKGEVVWTVNPQEVVVIGRLFLEGRYNTERLVAVAGPVVTNPRYVKTYRGAAIANMVKGNLTNEHVRYITGDVLTGKKVAENGHIGFTDTLVSVIEEGDFYEMFGWLLPSYPRPSVSPTIPWSLLANEEFDVNTNTHGEDRAFVVTGEYERVLPMDIYPMQLMKAIMAKDFDLMEGLGIYEVNEEDVALCEFVCPSKTNFQEILREGLDYMREQS